MLRNFLRRPEALLSQARRTEEGRWSYPQWWIDEGKRVYPACYGAILEAGNAHPPMTLRVNLRLIRCEAYLALLHGAGISAEQVGRAALLLAEPSARSNCRVLRRDWCRCRISLPSTPRRLLDLVDGQTRARRVCGARRQDRAYPRKRRRAAYRHRP